MRIGRPWRHVAPWFEIAGKVERADSDWVADWEAPRLAGLVCFRSNPPTLPSALRRHGFVRHRRPDLMRIPLMLSVATLALTVPAIGLAQRNAMPEPVKV